MTFTSVTFLLFLAAVLPIYWLLRDRTKQNAFLIMAGYLFYAWWDWRFAFLMLGTGFLDFVVGLKAGPEPGNNHRRVVLWLGLSANLACLGFFKYFNFFTDSFHDLMLSLGFEVRSIAIDVILPVGISFYTFQSMSYTIDVYHGKTKPERNVIDYLAFVSFFPQLMAGPIERAHHMLPQFRSQRVFNPTLAADGCRQILWGVAKKMVIADNLAAPVQVAFSNPSSLSGADLALGVFLFAFQIYCDFSAYSDIALGLARLLGFDLMRNFAYPYFSQSVGEFWRRWHISLSTWFRDYVYFPLGGNRGSRFMQVRNVLVTFTISGLWHGAAWTYVLWGFMNGLALIPALFLKAANDKGAKATDVPGGPNLIPSLGIFIRMVGTFIFICVTWAFFRAATISDAMMILRRIAMLAPAEGSVSPMLTVPNVPNLIGAVFGLLLIEWVCRAHQHPLAALSKFPRPVRWVVYTALIWLTAISGTLAAGQFIYFQF